MRIQMLATGACLQAFDNLYSRCSSYFVSYFSFEFDYTRSITVLSSFVLIRNITIITFQVLASYFGSNIVFLHLLSRLPMLDVLQESDAGVTLAGPEEAGDELDTGPAPVHNVPATGLYQEHGDHLCDGDPGHRQQGQDVSLWSALTQCGTRDM